MSEPDDPGDGNDTPPRAVVVPEVFSERPEGWKPDPGFSRSKAQNAGPLAAVELANFGVPLTPDQSAPPVDTVQMPPHRAHGAPVEATVELPPHRSEPASSGTNDTQQMPPHRPRKVRPEALDETVKLPKQRSEALDETVKLPKQRAEHPNEFDQTLELSSYRSRGSASGPDAQAKQRDQHTALAVLVLGLLLVGGVWAGLNRNTPVELRSGGPPVARTASYGGGGGGGGGGGHGGGGSGGPKVGMPTPDSEVLAADATGADACVARCARRQARCAQTCRTQEKCRDQCLDSLLSCENGCGGGAGFANEEGRSVPAGPTTLDAAQQAAARKLCPDEEGALKPCPEQESKLAPAEAIVRRMCGKDPDFPCPAE